MKCVHCVTECLELLIQRDPTQIWPLPLHTNNTTTTKTTSTMPSVTTSTESSELPVVRARPQQNGMTMYNQYLLICMRYNDHFTIITFVIVFHFSGS